MIYLTPQQDLIVRFLKKTKKGITSYECFEKLKITKLGTRISELRKLGYEFSGQWELSVETGSRYIRYFLIGFPKYNWYEKIKFLNNHFKGR